MDDYHYINYNLNIIALIRLYMYMTEYTWSIFIIVNILDYFSTDQKVLFEDD